MANIAKTDRESMNALFASEVSRMTGGKVAVAGDTKIDAFKDHKEYMDVLAAVMADDKQAGPDPNGDFFE